MKKQIRKISIIQTSKVVALIYAFFSLLHFTVGLFMTAFCSGEDRMIGIFFMSAPIMMAIGGFVMTVVMSAIYNFIASKAGGIEFELEDVE